MDEWLKDQFARGFVDFEGTTVSGAIPIKTDLINLLIARYLAQPGPVALAGPSLDAAQLVRFVRAATVEAGPGVVTLRFDIGI